MFFLYSKIIISIIKYIIKRISMFYYLLYNSSFSFIVESRLFSTILYGSILYILTHAVLNYCDISILNIINNYYWTLFTLDIISCIYSLYQSFINGNNITNDITNDITNNNGQNNLNVSFNLFNNKLILIYKVIKIIIIHKVTKIIIILKIIYQLIKINFQHLLVNYRI